MVRGALGSDYAARHILGALGLRSDRARWRLVFEVEGPSLNQALAPLAFCDVNELQQLASKVEKIEEA